MFQSSEVRDCCYMSEWNQCGPGVCKTLIIMMERTKRPLVLTAGKFADLSHDSLIAVMVFMIYPERFYSVQKYSIISDFKIIVFLFCRH